MRDDRAVVRTGQPAPPVCLLSAAACVLVMAVGCLAAGHYVGLFIPLGSLGGGFLGVYWLGVVVWFISMVFAATRARLLAALASTALILLTLAPSIVVVAGCAGGGCI